MRILPLLAPFWNPDMSPEQALQPGAEFSRPAPLEEIVAAFEEDSLLSLYAFLSEFNEIGGFFSKSDSERILERHIFENMVYAFEAGRFVSRETKHDITQMTLLDAGTGPGLPGAIFACLHSSARPREVHLLDGSKRRLHFLEESGPWSKLNKWNDMNQILLSNQNLLHYHYSRAEEFVGTFDLIVSRAFLPFPYACLAVSHLQNSGGCYLPFLGSIDARPEFAAEQKRILTLSGYELKSRIQLSGLALSDKRTVAVLKKKQPVHKGRAFRWKYIKDQMV